MALRKNNITLPETQELSEILSAEARRDPSTGKATIHYPKFDTIIALLKHYNISHELFTDDKLNVYQVIEQGKDFLDILVKKILSDRNPDISVFDTAYDYLSEEDEPKSSDIIIVFGAKTPLRAEKAVQLYKEGLSKTILISGGNPYYNLDKTKTSEAERYADIMQNLGVPADHILLEKQAITLPDNVWRSLNYFEENKIMPKSIILVNSPYSQRRGWAIFRKHTPDSVRLYRVNSETGEIYKKENWYKQEDTIRTILNEFVKLRASVVYNTA
jgi:uncharacterized SAM-binding protein YcdF (DUF218 family)